MVQWMNLHWNKSFVSWTRLPLLYEKSGTIFLVLVGLIAARLAGTFENFKNPLLTTLLGCSRCLIKCNGVIIALPMYSSRMRCIVRHVLEVQKSGTSCFTSYFIILNDYRLKFAHTDELVILQYCNNNTVPCMKYQYR